MSRKIEGGCLCGKVRYRGEIDSPSVMSCYCRACQRATGSPHATFVAVPESVLDVSGEPASWSTRGDSGREVERFFCSTCGSQLWSRVEVMPGTLFVKVGSLDDADGLAPTTALWTSSRADWVQLDPTMTVFEKNPGR